MKYLGRDNSGLNRPYIQSPDRLSQNLSSSGHKIGYKQKEYYTTTTDKNKNWAYNNPQYNGEKWRNDDYYPNSSNLYYDNHGEKAASHNYHFTQPHSNHGDLNEKNKHKEPKYMPNKKNAFMKDNWKKLSDKNRNKDHAFVDNHEFRNQSPTNYKYNYNKDKMNNQHFSAAKYDIEKIPDYSDRFYDRSDKKKNRGNSPSSMSDRSFSKSALSYKKRGDHNNKWASDQEFYKENSATGSKKNVKFLI